MTPYTDVKDVPVEEARRITNCQNILLYGMWLEGAAWDQETQALVDSKSLTNHELFPIVEVEVCPTEETPMLGVSTENEFNDNP